MLHNFHKTDRLDPHICCLGWYPNIYVLHVWESVWKASAAIAGFQQNFEQNLLIDEQNSEQTKKAELGFMSSIIRQSLAARPIQVVDYERLCRTAVASGTCTYGLQLYIVFALEQGLICA